MKASTLLRSLALVAVTTSCAPQPSAPPPPDADAIRAALMAQLERFAPALDAKDASAVADLFTPDATWILPDASTYEGHDAIVAGAQAFFESITGTTTFGQVVIDDLIVVSDSEAVTFSHGDYTMTEPGKEPENRVNPFADHWEKGADGVWRIMYEVNSDGPAASSMPMGS